MRKTPSDEYLEKAKNLSKEETERLLSRTRSKLVRRLESEKITTLEVLAIQLEIEDEDLSEWREKVAVIRKKRKPSSRAFGSPRTNTDCRRSSYLGWRLSADHPMPDAAKKTEEFTRMPRVVYFPMEIALYDKLEKVILPLWYDDRPAWITVMKGAISKNAAYFNSHRMMRRYATEAYLR